MKEQDVYEIVSDIQFHLTEMTERLDSIANGKNYNALEGSVMLSKEANELGNFVVQLKHQAKKLYKIWNTV